MNVTVQHDPIVTLFVVSETESDRTGQVWETGGEEIWLITDSELVDGDRIKHSTLILFSPVKSLCGRASWAHEELGKPWEKKLKARLV
jgi:hypothetical protein